MYQRYYVEAAAGDQAQARQSEVAALETIVGKLRAAQDAGGCGGALACGAPLAEALDALVALWAIFLGDVSDAGNALPRDLRCNIISIGRWIFSRSAVLRNGEASGLDALIDVNIAIRDGLRER